MRYSTYFLENVSQNYQKNKIKFPNQLPVKTKIKYCGYSRSQWGKEVDMKKKKSAKS